MEACLQFAGVYFVCKDAVGGLGDAKNPSLSATQKEKRQEASSLADCLRCFSISHRGKQKENQQHKPLVFLILTKFSILDLKKHLF